MNLSDLSPNKAPWSVKDMDPAEREHLATIARLMAMQPDQIKQHFMQTTGGNTEDAFHKLQQARDIAPWNIPMRDAEHALFVESQPRINRLGAALAVPAYTGVKAAVQAMPEGVQHMINSISPYKLSGIDVTPASLGEIRAGMSPLLNGR